MKIESFEIASDSYHLSKRSRIAIFVIFSVFYYAFYSNLRPEFSTLVFFGGLVICFVVFPLIKYGSNFKKIVIDPSGITVDGNFFSINELVTLNYNLSPNRRNLSVFFRFIKNGKEYSYSYFTMLDDSGKMSILRNQLEDLKAYWEESVKHQDYNVPNLTSVAHLTLSFLSMFYLVIVILFFYFSSKHNAYTYDENFNKYYPVTLLIWLFAYLSHLLIYPLIKKAPKKFSLSSRLLHYKHYCLISFFLSILIHALSVEYLLYYNQTYGHQTSYKNVQCEIQKIERVGRGRCELRVDTICKSLGAEIRDYLPCSLESKLQVAGELELNVINQGSLGGYYWNNKK